MSACYCPCSRCNGNTCACPCMQHPHDGMNDLELCRAILDVCGVAYAVKGPLDGLPDIVQLWEGEPGRVWCLTFGHGHLCEEYDGVKRLLANWL